MSTGLQGTSSSSLSPGPSSFPSRLPLHPVLLPISSFFLLSTLSFSSFFSLLFAVLSSGAICVRLCTASLTRAVQAVCLIGTAVVCWLRHRWAAAVVVLCTG